MTEIENQFLELTQDILLRGQSHLQLNNPDLGKNVDQGKSGQDNGA